MKATTLLQAILLATTCLQASPPFDPPATNGQSPQAPQASSNPLLPLATFNGPFDVEVVVVPQDYASNPSGVFNVNGIPAGSFVRRAWFGTTSFGFTPAETATAVFAGATFGPSPPDSEDVENGQYCRLYRFDVTPYVSGDGTYPYSVTGTDYAFGDVLIVVFENPTLPEGQVLVNDGAESLDEASTTTDFDLLADGQARLLLFSAADNPGGTEQVRFNGDVVAGPGDIFNANQGAHASLVQVFDLQAIPGRNTVEVGTSGDWFGLHLAIIVGNTVPVELQTFTVE